MSQAVYPPAQERVLRALIEEAGYGNAMTVADLERETLMMRYYICEALLDLMMQERVRRVGRTFELVPDDA